MADTIEKKVLSEDEIFRIQLRQTFLEEAAFLLEDVEEAMLALDDVHHREDCLARIFQAAHSVKGSAASVGYTDLSGFAHIAEDCLSALRSRPDLVRESVVSLLLEAIDALKARVKSHREGQVEEDAPWNTADLTSRLKAATAELSQSSNSASSASPFHQAFGVFDEIPEPTHESRPTSGGTAADAAHPSGPTGKASTTILKIDAERVESVLQLVGQLVVLKSQLEQEQADKVQKSSALSSLDKIVRELYDKALSMRMASLKQLFVKMQRTIRDISSKLGKPVEFAMEGEETELDRSLIEQIGDPLTHLIRNAIDHGIEPTKVRIEKGKPEKGHISLRAYRRANSVVVEIVDDGGGIDRDRILAKAIDKKLITPAQGEAMSAKQVYDLLFLAGFSTAAAVTDLSGRGVGLDVVKSNVDAAKGQIEIESTLHVGTTFRIVLPLTAAIMSGVVVGVHTERYIIPMESVQEFIKLKDDMIKPYGGSGQLLHVRGQYVPLKHLGALMRTPGAHQGSTALLLDLGKEQLGVVVDQVLGISQVVLKSVGKLSQEGTISGAAVLGDGRVAPVIDVHSLASMDLHPEAS